MEDEDYDENHQSSPLRLARHLTSLAHEFLNSLNPLHAILALETTFQNPQAKFPSSMNIEEVKNRKLIGSILNAITENQAEAKRHLEFGKVVLKDHARYEVLKYETFYELAIANRNLVPTDGEKAKKMEEESLNNCLDLAKRMKEDASGVLTKTERDEWRLRFAFTLLAMGEMHLRNESFSKSERSFGLAFKAVEVMERELVKRRNGEEEKLLMKEEKNGLTRLKLTVALADFERAILQRASGEEPSRVSKAMKRAEMIAKDVHAMDEHAREQIY